MTPQPEQPIPVPGYPEVFVTSVGRVFRKDPTQGHFVPIQWKTERSSPYFMVGVRRADGVWDSVKRCRLMALAFHGEPPFERACVRHLNDMKYDDRAENLAWGTAKDNARDAAANGTLMRGTSHYRSTLPDSDVVAIHKRYYAGETMEAVGREFGVSRVTVKHIVRGESWKHLGLPIGPKRSDKGWTSRLRTTPDDTVDAICAELQKGATLYRACKNSGMRRAAFQKRIGNRFKIKLGVAAGTGTVTEQLLTLFKANTGYYPKETI